MNCPFCEKGLTPSEHLKLGYTGDMFRGWITIERLIAGRYFVRKVEGKPTAEAKAEYSARRPKGRDEPNRIFG